MHYAIFLTIATRDGSDKLELLERLDRILNVWLPVLVGIVSSAATYYFTTKGRKRR